MPTTKEGIEKYLGNGMVIVLDAFPIVKRKDEAKRGNYRTVDTILEIIASILYKTEGVFSSDF